MEIFAANVRDRDVKKMKDTFDTLSASEKSQLAHNATGKVCLLLFCMMFPILRVVSEVPSPKIAEELTFCVFC